MSVTLGKIVPRRLSVELKAHSADYSEAIFMVYYTDEGRDPVAVGTLTYKVGPFGSIPMPEMDQALEYFTDANAQLQVNIDRKCLMKLHEILESEQIQ